MHVAAITNTANIRLALLLLVVLPTSVCATSLGKLPDSVASALAQAGVPDEEKHTVGIFSEPSLPLVAIDGIMKRRLIASPHRGAGAYQDGLY